MEKNSLMDFGMQAISELISLCSQRINCIYSTIFFLFLGDFHPEVDIDERIRRLQNDFGVDVLFTWGIIEQEGKNLLSKIFLIKLGMK